MSPLGKTVNVQIWIKGQCQTQVPGINSWPDPTTELQAVTKANAHHDRLAD